MIKRTLGLDIGSHSIKATVVESSGRIFTVAEYLEMPVEEDLFLFIREQKEAPAAEPPAEEAKPEAQDQPAGEPEAEVTQAGVIVVNPLVKALRRFREENHLQADEFITCLPSWMVSTRILDLPFDNRKKINLVIDSEVAEAVPFPTEDLLQEYQVLSTTDGVSKILVGLVDRGYLRLFLAALAAAEMDPRVVETAANSLSNLAEKCIPPSERPYALIDIGWKDTVISIMNAGALAAQRTVMHGCQEFPAVACEVLPGEAASEDPLGYRAVISAIRQTLHSFEMEKNQTLEKVMLCGGGALDEGLKNSLAMALETPIEILAPLESGIDRKIDAPPEKQASMAKSLGLALRPVSEGRQQQINFRKGEFVFKSATQQLETNIRRLYVYAAILFVLLVAQGFTKYSIVHGQAVQIKAQVARIYSMAFPGQVPPNPVASFKANVDQTQKKYKIIGGMGDGSMSPLGILKDISEKTPKSTDKKATE